MAYDQINPPPDPWLQTGLLCSLLANLFGNSKKRHKPDTFMPPRKRVIDDSPEQEQAQKSKLDRYFARLLGKEK